MRKNLSIAVLLLSLILVISAGTVLAKEKVVLKAVVTQEAEPFFQDLARQLDANHPEVDIEVQLEAIPYGDIRMKLLTMAAAGNAPDVALIDYIWMGEFWRGGFLMDITDKVSKEDKEDFFPNIWDGFVRFDDRAYGVPISTDTREVYYYKPYWQDAGIDSVPSTWTELLDVAQKLNAPPHHYGLGIWMHSPTAFYVGLWQGGGEVVTEKNGKAEVGYASPAGQAALQLIVDAHNKYKVAPTSFDGELDTTFLQGKYACYLWGMGSNYYDIARGMGWSVEDFTEKIGVSENPLPDGVYDTGNTQQATMIGGWAATVFKDTDYPELALEFILSATSQENAIEYSRKSNTLPVRRSAYTAENIQLMKGWMPYVELYVKELEYAQVRPSRPEYPQLHRFLTDAMQAAVLQPKTPVKQHLDAAAKKGNGVLGK
jgi:multiple sugar transport system substrate-binding protein